MEPADELRLGFDEVEGRAVRLRDGRDQIDGKPDDLRDDVPELGLRVHDAGERRRPRQNQHADDRHRHRELVADHLRRRAHAAQQRKLRAGGPARERDAVDADRSQGEDEQDPGVDVADPPQRRAALGERDDRNAPIAVTIEMNGASR